MLFILYNNVVLSLFLRAFYTVFCILYTYFLYISYTFYTYFVHFSRYFLPFLRKNNALLVHYWLNITHFRAFLTHFRVFFHQFPTIFCTFAQALRAFSHICTALHFSSFFIFCTFVQTFSTHCTKLYLWSAQLFWHICTNFFQLAAALFPACENFMTICFQLPCKISQLSTAFSYVTTAFLFHFVSVSTAFSIRNVSVSTTFLAHIVYATTMFLTHNIYLSITKYL